MPELDYEETYEQQVGRSIVAYALRRPGTDVAWATVPSVTEGFWMAEAVEAAALEVRIPSQCGAVFAALDGGF